MADSSATWFERKEMGEADAGLTRSPLRPTGVVFVFDTQYALNIWAIIKYCIAGKSKSICESIREDSLRPLHRSRIELARYS